MVPVSLTQGLTQKAVHTHRHTDGAADEQILHREIQRQSRYGTLRNLGHIDAVHHIVNRLHQHGQDEGQGHSKQQPSRRPGSHFVLIQLGFFLFFHDSPWIPFSFFHKKAGQTGNLAQHLHHIIL